MLDWTQEQLFQLDFIQHEIKEEKVSGLLTGGGGSSWRSTIHDLPEKPLRFVLKEYEQKIYGKVFRKVSKYKRFKGSVFRNFNTTERFEGKVFSKLEDSSSFNGSVYKNIKEDNKFEGKVLRMFEQRHIFKGKVQNLKRDMYLLYELFIED